MDPDAQGGPSPSSPKPRPASARRRPPARRRPVRRAAPPAKRGPSQRTSVVVLSALTVVVAAVAVGAFMIGSNGQPGAPASGPTTTTQGNAAGGSTLPPAALRTFRDPETGFSIQFPTAWKQLQSPDPNVRLVAAAGENDAMSVRVQRFEQPTTPDNLENIKAFSDAVVSSNKSAKVLQERSVTVDGMLGFYYLYTYADPSGQEGVHAHYFLFRGRKANQLVFQAVPSSGFDRLAAVFDQVADSFRSDPE